MCERARGPCSLWPHALGPPRKRAGICWHAALQQITGFVTYDIGCSKQTLLHPKSNWQPSRELWAGLDLNWHGGLTPKAGLCQQQLWTGDGHHLYRLMADSLSTRKLCTAHGSAHGFCDIRIILD